MDNTVNIDIEKRIYAFIKEQNHIYGNGYGDGSGFGDGDGSENGYGDGSGSGDGAGDGDGSENGYGYGDGSGSGDGYGDGSGSGDGAGDGSGNGSGYGDGSENGSGYGYGNRDGSGHENSILSVNEYKIFIVDELKTIFYSIKKNIGFGAILHEDLTLTNCYIVKNKGFLAHGRTIKEALIITEDKFIKALNVDGIVKEFKKTFNYSKLYSAKEFFRWHNLLTGSCELGRIDFCKNNNITLGTDKFTVKEFIKLTKNSYGKEIINKL